MKRLLVFLLGLSLSLSYAQHKKNFEIGILLDHNNPELAPLLTHLENEVKAVVGEDANITFSREYMFFNDFNIEKAKNNYQKLLESPVDMVLAFGVVNNQIISQLTKHKKPTILFGVFNRDFNTIDITKKTSEIKNFTYLIESESYIEDLKTLKELTNFTKVGIAIDAAHEQFLPLKEIFDKEIKPLGVDYKIIPFTTVTDISANLDGIDALYLGAGPFLKEDAIKQLAKVLIDKEVPSFTNGGVSQVKLGIMGTNRAEDSSSQLHRRIALTIDAFINGTPLAEMNTLIDYDKRLTVNYNTTEKIKVPIKYSLVANTDFVGEFKNPLSKESYNLVKVINTVLDKNLSLQASEKDVALSKLNVKTAKSNYLPSLTASANAVYTDPELAKISGGQNPEYSTSGNVTLQQTLFSAGAGANITVQENLEKAQQENYNAEQLTTVFNASNAYFNALILKTNAQIQLQNLNLTKRNLQIANQNFKAGEKGKTDVLRFRSQMAQNTQSMIQAINQFEQGLIGLNQLLNNPVEYEIEIEEVSLNDDTFKSYNYDTLIQLLDDPAQREYFIEFLVKEAKQNAPELKSLNYNIEAINRNIRLNSTQRFLPTVALQGQYNRQFSTGGLGSTLPPGSVIAPKGNYNVSVNVSIPIFNRTQTNINRQTAIIQKEQLELNKNNTQLSIDANVRNGVLNLINQLSNIELSKVSEATAKESLELTQSAYSNGAVNIVQLIDSQNNYLNAQLAKANATYNFLINSLQLERYIGYYFLLNSEAKNTEFRQRFMEFLSTKQ